MRARGASATGFSQALLGLLAHLAAGGCLPPAAALSVALPLSWAGVIGTSRGLRSLSPFARLLAGQAVVHAVLGVAARCTAHGEPATGHTSVEQGPWTHLAMAAAHLLITGLCLGVVGRCEAALATAVGRACALVRSALRQQPAGHAPVLAVVRDRQPVPTWPRPRTALSSERAAQQGLRGPPAAPAPAPA